MVHKRHVWSPPTPEGTHNENEGHKPNALLSLSFSLSLISVVTRTRQKLYKTVCAKIAMDAPPNRYTHTVCQVVRFCYPRPCMQIFPVLLVGLVQKPHVFGSYWDVSEIALDSVTKHWYLTVDRMRKITHCKCPWETKKRWTPKVQKLNKFIKLFAQKVHSVSNILKQLKH